MLRRITGQREPIATTIIVGGSTILGALNFMKDTILPPFYNYFILLKGDNGVIEPSKHLVKLFYEVSKDTNAKEFTNPMTSIRPMLVPGFHCLRIGTFGTHYGIVVGLPAFFDPNAKGNVGLKVNNADDFLNQGKIEDQPEYFKLSDKAKKYAIAREILLANSGQCYINCALPALVAYPMNIITQFLATVLEISRYPKFMGRLYYVSMVAFGLVFLKMTYSNVDDYFESDLESDILTLGEDYIEGAKEYYAKYIDIESSDVVKEQKRRIFNKIRETFLKVSTFSSDQLNSKKLYYENLVIDNKTKL